MNNETVNTSIDQGMTAIYSMGVWNPLLTIILIVAALIGIISLPVWSYWIFKRFFKATEKVVVYATEGGITYFCAWVLYKLSKIIKAGTGFISTTDVIKGGKYLVLFIIIGFVIDTFVLPRYRSFIKQYEKEKKK